MFILDLTTRAVGQDDEPLMTRLARQHGQLPQAPILSHSAANPDQFARLQSQIDPQTLDDLNQQFYIRTMQQQLHNEFNTELARLNQPGTISPLDAEIERLQRALRNDGQESNREGLPPDDPRRNTRNFMSLPTAATVATAFQYATSCPNIAAYNTASIAYNAAHTYASANLASGQTLSLEAANEIRSRFPAYANAGLRTQVGHFLTTVDDAGKVTPSRFGKILTLGGWANAACVGLVGWNVGKMWYNYFNYTPGANNEGNNNNNGNAFANYLRGQTEGSKDKLFKAAMINTVCTYGIGALMALWTKSAGGFVLGQGIGNIIGNGLVSAISSTNSFASKVLGWIGL